MRKMVVERAEQERLGWVCFVGEESSVVVAVVDVLPVPFSVPLMTLRRTAC